MFTKHKKIFCYSAVVAASIFTIHCQLMAEGFDIQALPVGSEVTIPNPAITYVPVTSRVTITSTDMPQTVKMSSVNTIAGKAIPLRVAIFDANSTHVKYLTVRPGMSYLYSFKNLGSINLVPERPKTKGAVNQYSLRLESDKPLGLSR